MVLDRVFKILEEVQPLPKSQFFELVLPALSYRQADNIFKGRNEITISSLDANIEKGQIRNIPIYKKILKKFTKKRMERFIVKIFRRSSFLKEIHYWSQIKLKTPTELIELVVNQDKSKGIFTGAVFQEALKYKENGLSEQEFLGLRDKCTLRLFIYLFSLHENEFVYEFFITKPSNGYSALVRFLPTVGDSKLIHPQAKLVSWFTEAPPDIRNFEHFIELIIPDNATNKVSLTRQIKRWTQCFHVKENKKVSFFKDDKMKMILNALKSEVVAKRDLSGKDNFMLDAELKDLLVVYRWTKTLHSLLYYFIDNSAFESTEELVHEFTNYVHFSKYHKGLIDHEQMVEKISG